MSKFSLSVPDLLGLIERRGSTFKIKLITCIMINWLQISNDLLRYLLVLTVSGGNYCTVHNQRETEREKQPCLCSTLWVSVSCLWGEWSGIFIGLASYLCDARQVRKITAFSMIWLIAKRSFCCFSPNTPKSNLSQISGFNKASRTEGDERQKSITSSAKGYFFKSVIRI